MVGHQWHGRHGSLRELHQDIRNSIREAKLFQIVCDLEAEYLKQQDIVETVEKMDFGMGKMGDLDKIFGPGGPKYNARLYNICPKRQESPAGKRITTFHLSIFP